MKKITKNNKTKLLKVGTMLALLAVVSLPVCVDGPSARSCVKKG